jgi:hypothetical protein
VLSDFTLGNSDGQAVSPIRSFDPRSVVAIDYAREIGEEQVEGEIEQSMEVW